jgi:hypothetical protein
LNWPIKWPILLFTPQVAMASRQLQPYKRGILVLLAVATTAVLLLSSALHNADFLGSPPAIAQRISPDTVWQQVYEKLPDFPRENQYVSVETRKVAPENTLVGRLVRYHVYVKGRPPQYRLDWKITLADYLGINERMDEESYPSRSTLKPNPMAGDLAAMGRLNRAQREALVQALVDAFAPPVHQTAPPATRAAPPAPSPIPTSLPKPVSPPARGPGAADLLK